jgi:hypothetical protein
MRPPSEVASVREFVDKIETAGMIGTTCRNEAGHGGVAVSIERAQVY